MNSKDDPKRFSLDMSFDEALGRYIQTKPEELLAVQSEDIPAATIEGLISTFEDAVSLSDDGGEYWLARDLQKLFDYAKWENFEGVLSKAMASCASSTSETGQEVSDHWLPDVRKSISGKGREDTVIDYRMSRYACYLTAMNADGRKRPVAFAQSYFAIQTRRQETTDSEVAIPLSEDEQRVFLRDQIKEHNKKLSSAAKGAGVITPVQFARFHTMGYKGLYGMSKAQIQNHKGLKKSADILDRMGSTELAANFFRVTQTEEKLRNENIRGAHLANQAHFEVGQQVRKAMLNISGTKPEDLPAVGTIAQAKKRLKTIPMKGQIGDVHPRTTPDIDETVIKQGDGGLVEIDLKDDLWKYALLIMVQRPSMEVSTADLIAELPNYIRIPDGADANNSSRADSKFSQIVRNLKSHKDSATNFIHLGYAEGIPRGFRATEKGREFVLKFFEGRI